MMEPLRVGACVFAEGERFFSWRGDTAYRNTRDNDNNIEILDMATNKWTSHPTSGCIPCSITGCGATAVNERVFLFGGFTSEHGTDNVTYFRDLFELNIETFEWTRIIPINDGEGPIQKYIFGIGPLNGSVIIFGGFGHKGDHGCSQPWSHYDWSSEFSAMWTNELHLYNPATNMWISPVIEGIKPSPCAAFCFNKIDKTRFLMFGGRQKSARVNEVQILDTATWTWSGPIFPTTSDELWPPARSLHTGVSLSDPELLDPPTVTMNSNNCSEQSVLLMWGQDHASDPISDLWMLRVNSLKWVKLDDVALRGLEGRKWHSTAVIYSPSGESSVITIGGFSKTVASWLAPHHEDTVVMKFGVANLYSLCLKYFSINYPKPSEDFLNYLPTRVANDIQRTASQPLQNDRFTHYDLTANVQSC